MSELVEQVHLLFNTITTNSSVDTKSPLVRTTLAIISQHPDIFADQLPLSAFNVLLSEYHGKCFMPVQKPVFSLYNHIGG